MQSFPPIDERAEFLDKGIPNLGIKGSGSDLIMQHVEWVHHSSRQTLIDPGKEALNLLLDIPIELLVVELQSQQKPYVYGSCALNTRDSRVADD